MTNQNNMELWTCRERLSTHRAADEQAWEWEFDGVADVEALIAKASPERTGPSVTGVRKLTVMDYVERNLPRSKRVWAARAMQMSP